MDPNYFHQENEHAAQLLEEDWFFGNLLQTKLKSKSGMLRSFSDPCSSLNFPGKSYEETYETIKKGTIRTTMTTRSSRKTSSSKKSSLVRAPSLPTSLESEDFHDQEVEFSMGKLIRQASLNYSDTRPPRQNASKSFTASPSLTRQRSMLKPAMAAEEEMRLKSQKSLKDMEVEELQGLKDLGLIDLDKKDLSPSVVSIIPGLQEKKRIEEYEERRAPRPYLSEAWAAQSSAPPVPRWGGKRAPEDMKAQIRFWARAVASNVRQEC